MAFYSAWNKLIQKHEGISLIKLRPGTLYHILRLCVTLYPLPLHLIEPDVCRPLDLANLGLALTVRDCDALVAEENTDYQKPTTLLSIYLSPLSSSVLASKVLVSMLSVSWLVLSGLVCTVSELPLTLTVRTWED